MDSETNSTAGEYVMLSVIAFVCGAALMGLEMVAARLLTHSLGNSCSPTRTRPRTR